PAAPSRKTRSAAAHAVDAAEPAQPVAGLREGYPHMPGATMFGPALQRRHHAECQEIAAGMVEHLRRQGFRLGRAECFSLRGIKSARRLHARIETAAPRPRTA